MFEFLRRLLGGKLPQASDDIRPVSEALQRDDPLDEALRQAVDAIDSVHKDGKLPRIRVTRAVFTSKHGRFAVLDTGELVIQISYITLHAELTTVHEVEHFLDFSGLGPPGELASFASSDLPTLPAHPTRVVGA